jgi:hypothetical protein
MAGQDAVVDAVADAGLDAPTALVAAYLGAVETASNWLPNMCHAVYARATRGEAAARHTNTSGMKSTTSAADASAAACLAPNLFRRGRRTSASSATTWALGGRGGPRLAHLFFF